MLHLTARWVHYRLSAEDVAAIDEELPQRVGTGGRYLRNPVSEGDVYPALVVATFGAEYLNLQVFLDGPCSFWATSRHPGGEPGQWTWAQKAHLVSVDYAPAAPVEG